jgi:hypothetical protein
VNNDMKVLIKNRTRRHFNATLNQHLSRFAPSALVAEINWTLVLSTRTTPTFGFSGSLALRRRAY